MTILVPIAIRRIPPKISARLPSRSPAARPRRLPIIDARNVTEPITLAATSTFTRKTGSVIPTTEASMLVAIAAMTSKAEARQKFLEGTATGTDRAFRSFGDSGPSPKGPPNDPAGAATHTSGVLVRDRRILESPVPVLTRTPTGAAQLDCRPWTPFGNTFGDGCRGRCDRALGHVY